MSEETKGTANSIQWWVIGLSILAANISYDSLHMGASLGYTEGLAMGSYEWTGSLLMIFILLFIFPVMMSTGVKTIPEYFGVRFNLFTRKSIAIIMLFIHVFLVMVSVLYSACLTLTEWYGLSYEAWLVICVLTMAAVLLFKDMLFLMRINIILISLMMIAGLFVVIYCFYKVGGLTNFASQGAPRINGLLPSADTMLPWHSVVFGGLWVAHAYYWSCNQYIQQFVLSANTLSKAQFGFLFAATLKLLIPFIIIIPGITLFILNKGADFKNTEDIFPVFVATVLPQGISNIIVIIYLSTLLATFSSVGFASINIVLNDLLPESSKEKQNQTSVYRIVLLLFVIISFTAAYFFKPMGESGLMKYNQMIMNASTPTIIAIFILGIFFKFTTSFASNASIVLSIPIFITIRKLLPELDLLNAGGIVFLVQCLLIVGLSYLKPEKEVKRYPYKREIRFERNLVVVLWSILLVTFIFSIYAILL